jgi:hypothetical protein
MIHAISHQRHKEINYILIFVSFQILILQLSAQRQQTESFTTILKICFRARRNPKQKPKMTMQKLLFGSSKLIRIFNTGEQNYFEMKRLKKYLYTI